MDHIYVWTALDFSEIYKLKDSICESLKKNKNKIKCDFNIT